jgi:hypothetical protein
LLPFSHQSNEENKPPADDDPPVLAFANQAVRVTRSATKISLPFGDKGNKRPADTPPVLAFANQAVRVTRSATKISLPFGDKGNKRPADTAETDGAPTKRRRGSSSSVVECARTLVAYDGGRSDASAGDETVDSDGHGSETSEKQSARQKKIARQKSEQNARRRQKTLSERGGKPAPNQRKPVIWVDRETGIKTGFSSARAASLATGIHRDRIVAEVDKSVATSAQGIFVDTPANKPQCIAILNPDTAEPLATFKSLRAVFDQTGIRRQLVKTELDKAEGAPVFVSGTLFAYWTLDDDEEQDDDSSCIPAPRVEPSETKGARHKTDEHNTRRRESGHRSSIDSSSGGGSGDGGCKPRGSPPSKRSATSVCPGSSSQSDQRTTQDRPSPTEEELREAKTSREMADLTNWYLRLNELIEYKNEHGDCDVPQKYSPNAALGTTRP